MYLWKRLLMCEGQAVGWDRSDIFSRVSEGRWIPGQWRGCDWQRLWSGEEQILTSVVFIHSESVMSVFMWDRSVTGRTRGGKLIEFMSNMFPFVQANPSVFPLHYLLACFCFPYSIIKLAALLFVLYVPAPVRNVCRTLEFCIWTCCHSDKPWFQGGFRNH